jgi:phosphatidylserine decarboxylase
MGSLCEANLPAPVMRKIVAVYSRAYDVNLEEVCPTSLPYTSFDSFFTRKLREGARPIDGDDTTLISPADGKLASFGHADLNGTITAKGKPYTLEELVGDRQWARELAGGGFCVVYLSPRDYHRVHAPLSGKVVRVYGIEGDRYPVNDIGLEHVEGLFVKNRRVVIEVESKEFGRVAVVMVGAMNVGRMSVVCVEQSDVQGEHRLSPAFEIKRGDELGKFHLGSTVVLLLPPDRFDRWVREAGDVNYGQAIAIAKKTPKGRNGSPS